MIGISYRDRATNPPNLFWYCNRRAAIHGFMIFEDVVDVMAGGGVRVTR